jgi:deoxyribose-phosphate aldolase
MDMSAQTVEHARLALACLDLTSLNASETDADITHLCQRATGRHGAVAAVCVWPRRAALARLLLPSQVAVAAVANFPDGSTDIARAVADTKAIVSAGAQEVDVVLPYRALMAGDEDSCIALLAAVRAACPGLVLKVILETGELREPALIRRASLLALNGGADILKTSTGKVAVNATEDAARVMLRAIADEPAARERVGFKPAGGVRTVADAAVYIMLVREMLGDAALSPTRFRIGASALLDNIEAVLDGAAAPPPAATADY